MDGAEADQGDVVGLLVAEGELADGLEDRLADGLGTAVRLGDVSLADALDMAGARPRELLGLPPQKLEPGFPADLVLFDWQAGGDFEVKATVVGGKMHPADGA